MLDQYLDLSGRPHRKPHLFSAANLNQTNIMLRASDQENNRLLFAASFMLQQVLFLSVYGRLCTASELPLASLHQGTRAIQTHSFPSTLGPNLSQIRISYYSDQDLAVNIPRIFNVSESAIIFSCERSLW